VAAAHPPAGGLIVYGAYFAVVARWLATTPADQIAYQPLMIVRYRRGG
jgi:hypothetical protein